MSLPSCWGQAPLYSSHLLTSERLLSPSYSCGRLSQRGWSYPSRPLPSHPHDPPVLLRTLPSLRPHHGLRSKIASQADGQDPVSGGKEPVSQPADGPRPSGSTPAPEPSAPQPSPGALPVQPSRGRGQQLTMEQMQREARLKLGELVQQQLEEEKRQRQQQQAKPAQPARMQGQQQVSAMEPVQNQNQGWAASPVDVLGFSHPAADTALAAADGGSQLGGRVGGNGRDTAGSTRNSSARSEAAGSNGGSGIGRPNAAVPLAADNATAAATTDLRMYNDPDAEWEALKAEFAQDWQRIKARWRQFLERPLDPPPEEPKQQPGVPSAASATSSLEVVEPLVAEPRVETAAGVYGTSASSSSSSSSAVVAAEDEGPSDDGEFRRRTTGSRLLQGALVAVFAAQWTPLVNAMAAGGGAAAVAAPWREVVLGLLLACPPTPLTFAWQADTVTVTFGGVGCLLSSAFLHSGLLSLAVSLASLEETAPWLETLHGFMIMIVSYLMAGVGAGLAQLALSGQAAGIAGVGAALGMEAAVAVRHWRMTGGLMPMSPFCLALCAGGLLMAWYQPLVGPWGILGGILGGTLSAVLAYDVLYVLRVVLAITILMGVGAWNLIAWLPRTVWRVLLGLAAFVWGTLVAFVQAVRGV